MNKQRLFSLAVFILLGCAGTMSAVKQNDTVKDKLVADSVKTGNELYVKNCGHCHKLKEPAKYTIQQWPGKVTKMQKRAKITDEQKAMILAYLETEAKK